MFKLFKPTLLGLSVAISCSPVFAEQMPSMQDMWKVIQQQQKMLEAQKAKIAQLEGHTETNKAKIVATEEKVEATTQALEQTDNSYSKVSQWFNKTSIGGYGELHYNNLDNQKDGGSDKDELDLHRFVLFFGHEFNEDLRFFSELEVEHALSGDGKSGEVELEQAYIEYDITDNVSAKGGMFLMPFGIVNETHEPPTFYGVERNPVEKNIIPSTWWEGGAGINSHFDNGLSADFGLTSGLYLTEGNSFAVRKGRQKVSKAKASSGALSGRVKYTGVPGLELSLSGYYQNDYNQDQTDSTDGLKMFETHAIYNIQDFTLKALYSQWKLDGDKASAIGADKQKGWYIEPSYKVTPKLGIFARYNVWDNTAGSSSDSEYKQVDLGVNYWLDEDVVLKADYQNQSAPDGKNEYDGFNLGIGYQF